MAVAFIFVSYFVCLVSYGFANPVNIEGRRFIDVPSSCSAGKILVHSGDCVTPFLVGLNTTTTATINTAPGTSTSTPSSQAPRPSKPQGHLIGPLGQRGLGGLGEHNAHHIHS